MKFSSEIVELEEILRKRKKDLEYLEIVKSTDFDKIKDILKIAKEEFGKDWLNCAVYRVNFYYTCTVIEMEQDNDEKYIDQFFELVNECYATAKTMLKVAESDLNLKISKQSFHC